MSQNGGNAKIGVADDVGNHLVQLFLKQIHGHVALHHSLFRFLFGFRERLLVHLLVLVQRDLFNLHRHGRNHVRRLLVEDEVVECFDVNLLVCNDIGSDELSTALIVESLHRGILDAWVLANDGFHLFQFDAESANLYLSVLAAHKLDVAIGQVAHNVAGAIGANVFLLGGEGVLDEHFCVFVRSVQVAERHLRSRRPQFTHSSHRHTVALLIDHIEPHVVQRLADGHILVFLGDGIDGDEDGGLRGTVAVVQLIACGRGDTGQFLTCHRHVNQRMVLDVRRKLIAHLCGHEGVGDVFALQICVERHEVQSKFLRNDVNGGTGRQRRIDTFLMHIETIAGVFRHVVLRLQVVILPVPVAIAHQIAVRQLATFGNACGTRCVEQDETVGWGKLRVES